MAKLEQLNVRVSTEVKATLKSLVLEIGVERDQRVSEGELISELILAEKKRRLTKNPEAFNKYKEKIFNSLLEKGVPKNLIARHPEYLEKIREIEEEIVIE